MGLILLTLCTTSAGKCTSLGAWAKGLQVKPPTVFSLCTKQRFSAPRRKIVKLRHPLHSVLDFPDACTLLLLQVAKKQQQKLQGLLEELRKQVTKSDNLLFEGEMYTKLHLL